MASATTPELKLACMLETIVNAGAPSGERLRKARALRDEVELLPSLSAAGLKCTSYVLQGSYKRRTGVRPLNDMDILLRLDEDGFDEWKRMGRSSRVFSCVCQCFKQARPHAQVTLQNSSIGVEVPGQSESDLPFHFDVVPSLELKGGGEKTYDRSQGEEHRSDYERDEQRVMKVVQKVPHARKVIRAVKLLNGMLEKQLKLDKPFRSFHLELLACESMNRVQHGSLLADFEQALKFIIANFNNCDVLPSDQERVGAYDEARQPGIQQAVEWLSARRLRDTVSALSDHVAALLE